MNARLRNGRWPEDKVRSISNTPERLGSPKNVGEQPEMSAIAEFQAECRKGLGTVDRKQF